MRVSHILIAAVLLVTSLPAANAQAGVGLTGKWQFVVQTDAGTGSPTVTFTQKGDSLSGHYSSQLLGERDFTGTVKDGKVTFSFHAEVQGQKLTVRYSGTVESANELKGTVELGELGTGTFTAKRL